jgi:hypothetical protein
MDDDRRVTRRSFPTASVRLLFRGKAKVQRNRAGSFRELRESLNLAIVAAMAFSKFPFLTLQAGALLRSLASARLSR